MSDIDFTVVLTAGLSPQQEFEYTQEFMASYQALKRWFPMLGEVEILNEEWCSAWSQFSLRGSEVGEWKLLHGTDSVEPSFVQNETRMIKNRLDHACWIYEHHILGRFYAGDQGTWIEKKALLRLARKVLRYARGKPGPATPESTEIPGSAPEIVLYLLGILDAQVGEAPHVSAAETASSRGFMQLRDEATAASYSAGKFAGLREYDSIILSVILTFSASYIVLKDGISPGSSKSELEKIRALCRANGICPLIVTRSVFRYYLQSYRPQVCLHLREYRSVLFGIDLLKEIAEPTAQSLGDELLNQSLNIMLAPARYVLARSSPALSEEWVIDAWRAAFLQLYLDTGITGSHQHRMEACQERFPELCREIARLSGSVDASESHALAVHALLRRCAIEINARITRSDSADPPITSFVSVVVPVFNGHDTIAACLDSLLALNFPREWFEIIVVDNASTDKTADVLSAYQDRVKLLAERTRGAAAARNRGIREAIGEIIAFTDADCTVDRYWLRHLVEPLQDRSAGIVGGRILSANPSNPIEKFGETIHDHQKAIEVFEPPYAISMNWASPRQVLIETGLFDESYLRCQDVDLSQRILRRGYRIVYQHEAVIYHRNERTFAGLFREGFQHGKWAVKHSKQQHAISARNGRRRINFHSYRTIGANLLNVVVSNQRLAASCQATFDIGKKLGKVVGSCQFGFMDL